MEKTVFDFIALQDAEEFLKSLPQTARRKIYYNIYRIQKGEKDKNLFKKLEGSDIWEFRTLYNGIAYRIFSFWDTETDALVLATHGLIKKTQKTPSKEIAKAERIRTEYFKNKHL